MINAQNAEEEFVFSYDTAIEFLFTPNLSQLYIVTHFYIRHCLCSVMALPNLGLK